MMPWIFGALLLNTAVAFFVSSLINHRLRYGHSAIWGELGKPSFLNNAPANVWRSAKYYLFTNKYKQLSDTVFDKLVLAIRINYSAQIALMIAFVIGMFFENWVCGSVDGPSNMLGTSDERQFPLRRQAAPEAAGALYLKRAR